MTERLTLDTSDGITLEARIDSPADPKRFTVFCHPHPEHGGSMNAPLMISVAGQLVERGHAVLRFNFRGTGASTGSHDYGTLEVEDISAAMLYATGQHLPVGLAGWSFGAWTAFRWHAIHRSEVPFVGIAPPARDMPDEPGPGPKRFVVGNRDQVIDPEALSVYAVEKGIDLVLTPGDHFFHGRGKRIGDLVGQGLEDGQ